MMKQLKPVELFLALGLAATLGACASPSNNAGGGSEAANETASTPASTQVTSAEGGEGGEGGESASTGNPNVDYMTTLGLMKGHLMVAEELMAQKNYEQAEPHIGHPVEELYGSIEGELAQRNVPQFKSTLNELHGLSKSAPDKPETTTAFKTSEQSIDKAIAAIPASERQSPEFVLNVINQMLKTAGEEYTAAIANNKFVELVEYQDSRGFVMYAEDLYQTIAQQMSQERPENHQKITASLEELKTAWPSLNPPATPVKTPSEVNGLISTIELQS